MGGAVKKVREVAKTAKGATKKETRDSVQAAMKESLGKPDKLVGGVYVSQVTETDAELFLEEAAIDEVDSVMSSCVESGDKLANGYDATTALGDCETKAKAAFKAFRGGEEAALGAEITALDTKIAGMAEGAAKEVEKATKATKEQKKKLKAREIEYTYTKSKQDAGRKNALAGVKAKMEDAKSKNIDTTSATFTEETRAMAKRAFKASMAVADIEDTEMEELLKETSKKEASDQLDSCYETVQQDSTKGASYLSSCQKEAMATARDARMPKKGSIEDLETEAERDVSFKKMMNEIAQEKASGTMAAAMRAKPDMTEREKLDTVKIEMKKSLATTEDISDSKIKDFIKKGAVKKVREVAKTAKGATKKETRDSVQAAVKNL